MRTNIVINDQLLAEAMRHTNARTKRAVVEEALRTFVELKTRESDVLSYKDRVRSLDAKLGRIRLRQSPAAVLREDRDNR